ncbi:MAG: putative sulfate/molybdate transporter [Synergistaceae bacterium]|jgi:hypothetical protein|nr:putative sulfate/molybdate transporter [Synergistaceae bacterium]
MTFFRSDDFRFDLRELAGSMGDFGTLFPLAIGYMVVCGVPPAGLLITLGAANIVTGLVYRLPMPLQPMKVLAAAAIAQAWSPSEVQASAFAMGIVWTLFAFTGIMEAIRKVTPKPVIRGIQLALGLLLARQALALMSTHWALALTACLIAFGLRSSKRFPAALILTGGGLIWVLLTAPPGGLAAPALTLPGFTPFPLRLVWTTFLEAGIAQVPLTATNAVLATSALIGTYWPDRPVPENRLALNMGLMNLTLPFFGAMPLCHGAGGLAGQRAFGARTGGANILEGMMEIALGLFFAPSLLTLFSLFPQAIVGAMMAVVAVELSRFTVDMVPGKATVRDQTLFAATALFAVIVNMALGFALGLILQALLPGRKGQPQKE